MDKVTFSDVLIEPRFSTIKSRKEVDISVKLSENLELELPVVSANMKTVTGPKMASMLSKHGGLGILHRFVGLNLQEQIDYYLKASKICSQVGVSIGVKEEDKKLFELYWQNGARIFCIDVAHGHHILVKEMLQFINNFISSKDSCCIIAGNVATYKAVCDLSEWGCHVVKVGIGPGSACITRANTGIGVPQLYALQQARKAVLEHDLPVKVISDGGIVKNGDVSKALVLADAVMIGGMLSGTIECPGKIHKDISGNHYKVYAGSASEYNKQNSGQVVEFIEGISKQIPLKGSVETILCELKDGIKSSFSYVNARNIQEFHTNAKLSLISLGSMAESKFI